MSEMKFMVICGVCGGEFQHGPHFYDGDHLDAYGINACSTCTNLNHDGWAPHLEPVLKAALKNNGLSEPTRLPNGLLPCNPRPQT